jgi:serine/threonine protein kinase
MSIIGSAEGMVGALQGILRESVNRIRNSLRSAKNEHLFAGRYVLGEQLGQGGTSRVFAAKIYDIHSDERDPIGECAIKIFDDTISCLPSAVQSVETQIRKFRDLAHPAFVEIRHCNMYQGSFFIEMERLEGITLAERLAGGERFKQEDGLRLFTDLLTALAVAHTAGVCHGDLKPSNIFLASDGQVRILDFGITGFIAGADGSGELRTLITPAYASPQRCHGEALNPDDDLYALACMIHEALAGQHPYERLSGFEAAEKGMTPPHLAMIPKNAAQMLTACLAFERSLRPKEARAAIGTLLEVLP